MLNFESIKTSLSKLEAESQWGNHRRNVQKIEFLADSVIRSLETEFVENGANYSEQSKRLKLYLVTLLTRISSTADIAKRLFSQFSEIEKICDQFNDLEDLKKEVFDEPIVSIHEFIVEDISSSLAEIFESLEELELLAFRKQS